MLNRVTPAKNPRVFMECPLDMNARSLHIGDLIEFAEHRIAKIIGFSKNAVFYMDPSDASICMGMANSVRKYDQTVEDILYEFALDIVSAVDPDALIESYNDVRSNREFICEIRTIINEYSKKLCADIER